MKTLGDIGDLIDKNPESKDGIKLTAFSELVLPFKFETKGGKVVVVDSIKVNEKIGALELFVLVDDKPWSGDGIMQFINPPILVPDGTKSTITNEIDGEKYELEVDNFKEDLDEALKQIVEQTIGDK
jgi:hypothetical protein